MSPSPDKYAVIGHPIAHSHSPWIHARFAEQTGQNLVYEAIDSPPDGFAASLKQLEKEGYAGANVTVPFKLEAFAAAGTHTPRAELAQAANTLAWQAQAGGKGKKKTVTLHADNTDGPGLIRDLVFTAGFTFAGENVLLLGAGGAGAGVLGSLIAVCPGSITIANRTLQKSRELIARHQVWANMHSVPMYACTLDEALYDEAPEDPEQPGKFALVVNATSTSLQEQPLALPFKRINAMGMVMDLMYGPAAEAFLQPARQRGLNTRDGLGMLVEQAALSFALWREVRPKTAPVLAELRKRVDGGKA
ncbi:MAG: shikimate dehydrogenase [Brachymonas sp.]|nr:shikimate dehydrogenase [Brachymonas sp.]